MGPFANPYGSRVWSLPPKNFGLDNRLIVWYNERSTRRFLSGSPSFALTTAEKYGIIYYDTGKIIMKY